ncbi:MAG: c-type cytochrome [bacterium]|nr:c-type cytochrome [bacterium]
MSFQNTRKPAHLMMKHPSRRFLMILVIVLSLGGLGGATVLMAQSSSTPAPEVTAELTPEATDAARDCTPAGLAAAKTELESRLADFETLLNDDQDAALSALYEVGQAYQQIALDCGYIPDDVEALFVGTNVENILAALETLDGDPVRGQLLYNNEQVAADGVALGCAGCHEGGAVGPSTEGTWTRWDEVRRLDPALADYSFEHYMVESIIHPNAYVPPEYQPNMMPQNYGERLTFQDLADLIKYLESQDQLLPGS